MNKKKHQGLLMRWVHINIAWREHILNHRLDGPIKALEKSLADWRKSCKENREAIDLFEEKYR